METLLRLDSISPSLAEAFRLANERQRRHAALATCLVAVAQTELQGDEVDAVVNLLHHGGNDQSDARRKLESLTAQVDEHYFKLSKGAGVTTTEALLVFRKARAAAALALAHSPDSGELHEAIYEAICASDDQGEAMRAADAALRAT